jgi:SAM-dependent methyltransferase
MTLESDSTSRVPDVHLDLGCGARPRNPYGRSRVCGVDIRALSSSTDFEFRIANLSVAPIPYDDDTFGSVSAFDFIEHIPRVLATCDGNDTFFPFVRLMDEIWRVLAPRGRLYALTPALPNAEAFVDPTHVNFITDRTHEYFCGDSPLGRMYGFRGRFAVQRVQWVRQQEAFTARPLVAPTPAPTPPRPTPTKRFAHAVRDGVRVLRGKRASEQKAEPEPERLIYFLWELEAVKPPSAAMG